MVCVLLMAICVIDRIIGIYSRMDVGGAGDFILCCTKGSIPGYTHLVTKGSYSTVLLAVYTEKAGSPKGSQNI